MGERIAVSVYARDPVLESGIESLLKASPALWVVDGNPEDPAQVAVVAADDIDEDVLRMTKAIQRTVCPRVLLIVTHPEEDGLMLAVEAGVCGLVRRAEAAPEKLADAIKAAAKGEGTLPADLLGRFLSQVSSLQRNVLTPRGLSFKGLTDREIEVLKLIADGLSTSEIAIKLAYSERTIKNVMQGITTRLNLRNRSHAVAYALREGLI